MGLTFIKDNFLVELGLTYVSDMYELTDMRSIFENVFDKKYYLNQIISVEKEVFRMF